MKYTLATTSQVVLEAKVKLGKATIGQKSSESGLGHRLIKFTMPINAKANYLGPLWALRVGRPATRIDRALI